VVGEDEDGDGNASRRLLLEREEEFLSGNLHYVIMQGKAFSDYISRITFRTGSGSGGLADLSHLLCADAPGVPGIYLSIIAYWCK
jgi:hypothetical protein